MGLLSKFNQAVASVGTTKIGTKIRESVSPTTAAKISDVANKALTILTSPIQSISNFQKAQEQTSQKSAARLIGEGIETTLIATAPFSSAGKTALAKVGAAATKTVPRTILTATAVGAAVASPTVRETAASLLSPVENIARGAAIGEKIEELSDPQKEGASKLLTGLAIGAGGVALAGGAALLLPKITDKVKGIFDKSDDEIMLPQTGTQGQISPILPETTTITKGTQKKRRRTTRKPKMEGVRVSQRVNVMVNNSNRKIYKGVVIK